MKDPLSTEQKFTDAFGCTPVAGDPIDRTGEGFAYFCWHRMRWPNAGPCDKRVTCRWLWTIHGRNEQVRVHDGMGWS